MPSASISPISRTRSKTAITSVLTNPKDSARKITIIQTSTKPSMTPIIVAEESIKPPPTAGPRWRRLQRAVARRSSSTTDVAVVIAQERHLADAIIDAQHALYGFSRPPMTNSSSWAASLPSIQADDAKAAICDIVLRVLAHDDHPLADAGLELCRQARWPITIPGSAGPSRLRPSTISLPMAPSIASAPGSAPIRVTPRDSRSLEMTAGTRTRAEYRVDADIGTEGRRRVRQPSASPGSRRSGSSR